MKITKLLKAVFAAGAPIPPPRYTLALFDTGGWAFATTQDVRPTVGTYTYDPATETLVMVLEDGSAYASGYLDNISGMALLTSATGAVLVFGS